MLLQAQIDMYKSVCNLLGESLQHPLVSLFILCVRVLFSPHAQRPEIVEDSQELILQMVVSYLVGVGNRTLSSKKSS